MEQVTDNRGATQIQYEAGNDRVHRVVDPVTGAIEYSYGLAGERQSMILPGGDTWNYGYLENWQVLPKDEPDSVSPMLRRITDDQGRMVDYELDNMGQLAEVWANQSFDEGGNLVSFQKTRYTFDQGQGGGSHRWLARIRNNWHWTEDMGQGRERTLVRNDYTCSISGAVRDAAGRSGTRHKLGAPGPSVRPAAA
jgi:hypothetical protein